MLSSSFTSYLTARSIGLPGKFTVSFTFRTVEREVCSKAEQLAELAIATVDPRDPRRINYLPSRE
jgi:hypothetical protein